MMDADTKTKILDAAEELFAKHGLDATSLRQITASAGVNLAAVNYYFGTKDELVRAVLSRRITAINQKRLLMLEAAEAASQGEAPPLRAVLEAFYAPAMELWRLPGRHFQPLLGRIFSEPSPARDFLLEEMAPVVARFGAVLRRILPHLPDQEYFWRMHFVAAILAFTMAGSDVLHKLSGGRCDLSNVEDITLRMVDFAAAGLKAPVTHKGLHL